RQLLSKGVDARRRSLSMKTEELERRIKTLEEDLRGTAGTIEQRRMKIREEISGIKVGAQKNLERFVEDTIRQLPNVIESAKQDDLRKFLPAFLEDTFRQWAEAESKEIAAKLETLAEKTIALIKEDAHDATNRVGEALGGDVKKLDIQVDTFRYDAGIAAVLVLGLGMMFVNVMVGGLLTIAAPIMALVLRDRIDAEYKKRAAEQAPEVLRQAAKQVGPKIDEMIEDFAKKLDAWFVTAGEDLYREVLEVLNASRDARANAGHDEAKAKAEVEDQASRLEKARTRIADLRATLWSPKDKVRVADSQTELAATD
ncbi:MAG TPA: hypothetical protein VM925_35535, partial [Labilithrix sp.]|nr:hypothetical protein [Labilithrix sp.]